MTARIPSRGEPEVSRDFVVVTLPPSITAANAPKVRRLLDGYVALGDVRLVVDLTGVTAIDAAGMAALLGGREAVARAGGVMIVRPSPQILAAFKRSSTIHAFETG